MNTEDPPASEGEGAASKPLSPPLTLAELCEACAELAAQIAAHFESLEER